MHRLVTCFAEGCIAYTENEGFSLKNGLAFWGRKPPGTIRRAVASCARSSVFHPYFLGEQVSQPLVSSFS